MSKDEEFLLYPLDTGDDPVCVACGKTMCIAAVEERGQAQLHHLQMYALRSHRKIHLRVIVVENS
jgi:hypothetical protein